jgi:hypothetical protein
MPGLVAKMGHVDNSGWIIRADLNPLTWLHIRQVFSGFQNGKRA